MRHAATFGLICLALCELSLADTTFARPPERLTLEATREALASLSNPSWKASDSHVWERLDIDAREHPFGLIESPRPSATLKRSFPLGPRSLRPSQWDWRDVDGKNFVTPVKNQGKCGACVAFATTAALESLLAIRAETPALASDLSEAYLFADIGSCDSGSTLAMGAGSLVHRGIVDEACLPYTAGRLGVDQNTTDACQTASSRLLTATSYSMLWTPEEIKEALLERPIPTSMTVFEDFLFYKSGVYHHVTGEALGGHAVLIVGYNDDEGYWIVKNSWGREWGEDGLFRVRYDDDDTYLGQAGSLIRASDADIPYRIQTPAHLTAARATLPIRLERLTTDAPATISYTLASPTFTRNELSGEFPPDTLEHELDIASLPDGLYELSIHTDATHLADHTLLVIANNEPDISLQLTPNFSGETVSGLVRFTLQNTSSIPLTHAIFRVRKRSVGIDQSITFADPGPESSVGWRTTMLPDGVYEVWMEGHVGALYTDKTPRQLFTVKNTPSQNH